jgi:hypothetical protein
MCRDVGRLNGEEVSNYMTFIPDYTTLFSLPKMQAYNVLK